MKRDEMLFGLSETIRYSVHAHINVSPIRLADEILIYLENRGMLPPNRPIVVPKMEPFEMIELDGVLIGTAPIVASVENSNTWEPEDNGLKK